MLERILCALNTFESHAWAFEIEAPINSAARRSKLYLIMIGFLPAGIHLLGLVWAYPQAPSLTFLVSEWLGCIQITRDYGITTQSGVHAVEPLLGATAGRG